MTTETGNDFGKLPVRLSEDRYFIGCVAVAIPQTKAPDGMLEQYFGLLVDENFLPLPETREETQFTPGEPGALVGYYRPHSGVFSAYPGTTMLDGVKRGEAIGLRLRLPRLAKIVRHVIGRDALHPWNGNIGHLQHTVCEALVNAAYSSKLIGGSELRDEVRTLVQSRDFNLAHSGWTVGSFLEEWQTAWRHQRNHARIRRLTVHVLISMTAEFVEQAEKHVAATAY
jgi:hypothetical protein